MKDQRYIEESLKTSAAIKQAKAQARARFAQQQERDAHAGRLTCIADLMPEMGGPKEEPFTVPGHYGRDKDDYAAPFFRNRMTAVPVRMPANEEPARLAMLRGDEYWQGSLAALKVAAELTARNLSCKFEEMHKHLDNMKDGPVKSAGTAAADALGRCADRILKLVDTPDSNEGRKIAALTEALRQGESLMRRLEPKPNQPQRAAFSFYEVAQRARIEALK